MKRIPRIQYVIDSVQGAGQLTHVPFGYKSNSSAYPAPEVLYTCFFGGSVAIRIIHTVRSRKLRNGLDWMYLKYLIKDRHKGLGICF